MTSFSLKTSGRFRPEALGALLAFGCLFPFITKAFHIDDPVYLWVARHILDHPFDFFGFTANWYGYQAPMYIINQNPPGVSYLLALVGRVAGWSEPALHSAFLAVGILLAVGTCRLARLFCNDPFTACAAAVLTPAFVVSSTNLMADTLMLCFYVWSVFLWVKGLRGGSHLRLAGAALLMSLAALTKYFGMTLIPLLLVYSVVERGRPGRWLLYLFIPMAALAGYQWITGALYGQGLISLAAAYAGGHGGGQTILNRTLTGFSFSGGALISVFFFAPLLWRGVRPVIWCVGIFLLSLSICRTVGFGLAESMNRPEDWRVSLQAALFITAGVHLLILTGRDLADDRRADSVLLFCWIFGTFVFAAYVNWTTNVRSVLPMAPAAGILVARRLIRRRSPMAAGVDRYYGSWWPLVPAAVIALVVAVADYSIAGAQRDAAFYLRNLTQGYSKRVWFQGHWGFQHYMESFGARPLDVYTSTLHPGDLVVAPENSGNVRELTAGHFLQMGSFGQTVWPWLGTMQQAIGAGFYFDGWGDLPFAFGRVPPERYRLYVFGRFEQPGKIVNAFTNAIRGPAMTAVPLASLSAAVAAQARPENGPFSADVLFREPARPAAAYLRTGDLLRRNGRLTMAQAQYRKALDMDPTSVPGLKGMALIRVRRGAYAQAREMLMQVEQLNPEDGAAAYLIAVTHAKERHLDDALRWLKTAVDLGYADRERIASDANLAAISGLAEFREWMNSLAE